MQNLSPARVYNSSTRLIAARKKRELYIYKTLNGVYSVSTRGERKQFLWFVSNY